MRPDHNNSILELEKTLNKLQIFKGVDPKYGKLSIHPS